MSKEFVDVFNDNMEQIGSATRDGAHQNGLWHHTFHCWIIRKFEGKHYVLFQRRGPDKKLFPNALDITAAGHILSGEDPKEGIRELNEELGINAKYEDLISLGIRCDVAIIGPVTNREFCHTFLYESNISLEEYNLQLDEVSGLVQIEINDGLKLFADEVEKVNAKGYQVYGKGKKQPIDIMVSKSDIIPRLDHYYMKIFIMAERYFQGKKYLAI